MDKIKIGIPRSMYYYYYNELWINFFKKLNIETVTSEQTNKQIMHNGITQATDEMCLSLKNFIGHVYSLKDKCDYILIPRIDNYGISNQTCTNFLASYDIIKNIIDKPILNYNININNKETEEKAFIKIGMELGSSKKAAKKAYQEAYLLSEEKKSKKIKENIKKLDINRTKILIISHPYNIFDRYIGHPITNYLKKNNIEIIHSSLFYHEITNKLSKNLSSELYWKYNKENIGSIMVAKDKIDGIIFLSSFPCGPDSLVNELVMRKITIPHINLIIDDLDSTTGLETRLESFIDIINERKKNND